MLFFAMKAAVASVRQLADRADRMRRLRLPLAMELHTTGGERYAPGEPFHAGVQYLRRIREQESLRLWIHVPYQQPDVVTQVPFDANQVLHTLELASHVDAEAVILHRYFALAPMGQLSRVPKAEAEASFNEEIRRLARNLDGRQAYVENLGFFWLRPRAGGIYLAGPVEHFFPWEVERFLTFLCEEGIQDVQPMVDIAHATLSSNMFALLHSHYRSYREDARFQGITDVDLAERDALSPYDFVRPETPYVHVSDALLLDQRAVIAANEPLVTEALTAEALPLGQGNLDLDLAMGQLNLHGTPHVVVAEVDPGDGQSHEHNAEQEKCVVRLLGSQESRQW
jgi:hypothetical protein